MADKTHVNILLTVTMDPEPNETKMTAIKFEGSMMEFKSFSGFTALDILNLLFPDKVEES